MPSELERKIFISLYYLTFLLQHGLMCKCTVNIIFFSLLQAGVWQHINDPVHLGLYLSYKVNVANKKGDTK